MFLNMRKLYFLLCFVAFSLLCFAEDSEKRVALVIGNQDYSGTEYNSLSNPVNDAKGMEDALKQMGFTISGGKALINANQDQMLEAIKQFRYDSRGATIAIFYYSGHGVTYDHDNLMLPVGKKIDDFYVERCVSLNTVRERMEDSRAQLNIIILDACRSALRNGGKGGESMNNGLLRTEIPEGFLYCYATSKNEEAIDRPNGKYSYFTEALINQMKVPNQKFGDMYRKVKNQVLNATNNRQRPTINNEDVISGTLDFYLSPQPKLTLSPVGEKKLTYEDLSGKPASTQDQMNTNIRVDKTTLEANRDNPKIREVVFESGKLKFVPRNFKGEFIIGNDITTIGDSAFFGCSGLTSITIPNSVTRIGNRAFKGCSGLTSVTIPNSVTSIGYEAFYGCSSISKPLYNNTIFVFLPRTYKGTYAIPDGIQIIADHAFAGCINLTDIFIPNSVTDVDFDAFYNCKNILRPLYNDSVFFYLPKDYKGTYELPSGIKKIATTAFASCKNHIGIVIPNSVTSIGYAAFFGCSGLTSVTIPNSVTSIGEWAFCGCSGLTSITIPNSVTSIGWRAFEGCSGLTSVTIPNSVTSIGYGAFYRCSSLTSVTIPNSVTSIGDWAFAGCSGLTSVTIPNSVTSIGDDAFGGCSGLTSVTIPNSVTSIGFEAFARCSGLTSVTIPNSVTSIGYYAFYDCYDLTSVTISNSVTRIGYSAFVGCYRLKIIYVPKGAKESIKQQLPKEHQLLVKER